MSRPFEPVGRARSGFGSQSPVSRGSRAVVGVDGTAPSLAALAYAVGWAHRMRGPLDVLYVSDGGWQGVIDSCAAVCPLGAPPECAIAVSEAVGSTVGDLLAGTDLTWSYHTASGDVAHMLETHADSTGADAIIVGRSHRCHRYSRRSTSTAHRLLACARRIVIVVP